MKTLHWLGVIALTLSSAPGLSGCSGSDTPTPAAGGSGMMGGAGGTGTTGGAGGGPPAGTLITGGKSFVILSGADAMPGTAAPASWANGACVSCHGPNAQGVDNLAPEIRHTPVTYATWVVRHGRLDTMTGMTPYDMTLVPDADLTAMLTWLGSLPKPTTGAGLYKDFCGNCHGPTTPTGGNAPINISAETIMNVQKFVRSGNGTDPANRKEYMPAFSATELTDAELTLIEQFIGAK